jgi:hypothetical protein
MNGNRKDVHVLSIRLKDLAKPLGVLVLALGLAIAAFPTSAEARVMQYLQGNSADVNPSLRSAMG